MLSPEQRTSIDAMVSDVRTTMETHGVTRDALEIVRKRLIALADRRDLFNIEAFPVQDGDGASSIYRLAEDEDHGYALYAVAERRGNMSPPHNHTTWAVIAGIEGEEVNRLYERLDDGAEPGKATVRESGEAVVRQGTAVAFLPDDIHSIHCVTDEPTLNFHLYGLSIEHLPNRLAFNLKDGTYKVFPANPRIRK